LLVLKDMKFLDGNELAGYIKERHFKQVGQLVASGIEPKLAIIQIKDDPVINTYVGLKQRYGRDIGIDVEIHRISQTEVPKLIRELNEDSSVHGIIIQLPLADPNQTDEIVNLVAPEKDVDALGDPNSPWPPGHWARRQAGAVRGSWFEPATPMAIMWLLAGYNIELAGKKILLIGRGKLVGAPLEKILLAAGYDVTVIDREVADLTRYTKNKDIIITATGSPAIIYPHMIKEGAVIVDAGVASESGKTVGDLSPEIFRRDDLIITPQKGGVGPLTVCALFENVIRAASRRHSS